MCRNIKMTFCPAEQHQIFIHPRENSLLSTVGEPLTLIKNAAIMEPFLLKEGGLTFLRELSESREYKMALKLGQNRSDL